MRMDDTRMETMMGRLLQAGVTVAGLLMLVGGAYYLSLHGAEMPNYRTFHGVAAMSGEKIVWAGVIATIATPVLRVAFAAVAFATERDWLYTGVSLTVLMLLAFSLFG
jgi:uncharacterized membrane protein